MTRAVTRGGAAFSVYTTSQFSSSALVHGELVKVPSSRAHGKETGTTLTLCGQPTLSWVKFWDLPFKLPAGDQCPECIAIVRERHEAPPEPRLGYPD